MINFGATNAACNTLACLDGVNTEMFVSPTSHPNPCFSLANQPASCLNVENGLFTPDDQGTVIKLTAGDFPNFATLANDLGTDGWSASLIVVPLNNAGTIGGGGGFQPILGQIDEVDFTLSNFCVSATMACQFPNGLLGGPFDLIADVNMTVLGTPAREARTTAMILAALAVLLVARFARRERLLVQ